MANEEMQKKFLAQVQEANGKVLAGKKARARLKAQSHKQDVRQAFLEGIRAERMRTHPWCEKCGVEGWEVHLSLHHIVKRSHQGRFDGDEYGVDRPQNLTLLCWLCHQRLESNPMWTKTGDAS